MKKMTGEQEGDKGQGEHPSRETTGVLGHLASPGKQKLGTNSGSRGKTVPICLCVDSSPRGGGR